MLVFNVQSLPSAYLSIKLRILVLTATLTEEYNLIFAYRITSN